MKYALILILGLAATLYWLVSQSVEKYAEEGQFRPRLIMGLFGLFSGAGGYVLLMLEIVDSENQIGVGFVVGPMCLLLSLYSIVVALFLPTANVRACVRYFFRSVGL